MAEFGDASGIASVAKFIRSKLIFIQRRGDGDHADVADGVKITVVGEAVRKAGDMLSEHTYTSKAI